MKGTITKIDGRNIHYIEEGKKDIGIAELEEWVKPDYVKLGDAEITIKDNKIAFCQMNQSTPAKPGATFAPAKKTKWEDEMVTFEDLLTAAHKKAKDLGLDLNILTSAVKDKEGTPMIIVKEQFAFFKGRVVLSKDGKEVSRYEGHGDATDQNVTGEFIKPHFIRMAETRAIVRALRWYTNNGCAEEEKGK